VRVAAIREYTAAMTGLRGERAPALTACRAWFGAVVVAATVSGLVLLIWPDDTGQFFSWGLGPPPLASLVGGLYLASASFG